MVDNKKHFFYIILFLLGVFCSFAFASLSVEAVRPKIIYTFYGENRGGSDVGPVDPSVNPCPAGQVMTAKSGCCPSAKVYNNDYCCNSLIGNCYAGKQGDCPVYENCDVAFCVQGKGCVECTNDIQCPRYPMQKCVNNKCVEKECPAGQTLQPNGTCKCLSNIQYTSGTTCVNCPSGAVKNATDTGCVCPMGQDMKNDGSCCPVAMPVYTAATDQCCPSATPVWNGTACVPACEAGKSWMTAGGQGACCVTGSEHYSYDAGSANGACCALGQTWSQGLLGGQCCTSGQVWVEDATSGGCCAIGSFWIDGFGCVECWDNSHCSNGACDLNVYTCCTSTTTWSEDPSYPGPGACCIKGTHYYSYNQTSKTGACCALAEIWDGAACTVVCTPERVIPETDGGGCCAVGESWVIADETNVGACCPAGMTYTTLWDGTGGVCCAGYAYHNRVTNQLECQPACPSGQEWAWEYVTWNAGATGVCCPAGWFYGQYIAGVDCCECMSWEDNCANGMTCNPDNCQCEGCSEDRAMKDGSNGCCDVGKIWATDASTGYGACCESGYTYTSAWDGSGGACCDGPAYYENGQFVCGMPNCPSGEAWVYEYEDPHAAGQCCPIGWFKDFMGVSANGCCECEPFDVFGKYYCQNGTTCQSDCTCSCPEERQNKAIGGCCAEGEKFYPHPNYGDSRGICCAETPIGGDAWSNQRCLACPSGQSWAWEYPGGGIGDGQCCPSGKYYVVGRSNCCACSDNYPNLSRNGCPTGYQCIDGCYCRQSGGACVQNSDCQADNICGICVNGVCEIDTGCDDGSGTPGGWGYPEYPIGDDDDSGDDGGIDLDCGPCEYIQETPTPTGVIYTCIYNKSDPDCGECPYWDASYCN